MYAGIDIGGTKTLVASINDHGVITEKVRFETPQRYEDFLASLSKSLAGLKTKEFHAAGLGMPATVIDRKQGTGISFGNLPWHNAPVQADVERLVKCPVVVDNDAKLAGLSEAMLLKEYDRVLYVTVSTGIGYSLIADQHIDPNIGDGGGRMLLAEHNGKFVAWESFASGHAIVERYGKKARDITDDTTWKAICRDLAKGLVELIAITQPDIIIIGGSVGTYFDRYGAILQAELKKYETPLMAIPAVRGAQRPEEAVLFGAYDLAKEHYAHTR